MEIMETINRKTKKVERTVFVTVGTTQFDKLIQTMCDSKTLQVNTADAGLHKDVAADRGREIVPSTVNGVQGITLDHYRFKPSIKDDIETADLVISHAGAGSCLETLGAGKNLLVVINDELMGNHQLELADQLHRDDHLYYCNCSSIVKTLLEKDFSKLEPFSPGKPELFAEFLDKMMGFT